MRYIVAIADYVLEVVLQRLLIGSCFSLFNPLGKVKDDASKPVLVEVDFLGIWDFTDGTVNVSQCCLGDTSFFSYIPDVRETIRKLNGYGTAKELNRDKGGHGSRSLVGG